MVILVSMCISNLYLFVKLKEFETRNQQRQRQQQQQQKQQQQQQQPQIDDIKHVKLFSQPKENKIPISTENSTKITSENENFSDVPDFHKLIDSPLIRKHGIHFEWIATRLEQDWREWVQAYRIVRNTGILQKLTEKRILLYLGLMEIKMGEEALKGGPVGELVQWSNLIACLFLYNYTLEIVVNLGSFKQIVHSQEFDLIFTDLIGMNSMSEDSVFDFKCKFRILDSFGTEPEFNIRRFIDNPGPWEKWNFEDTRQMLTLFPHTPDNSFLGFMIPTSQHKVKVKKTIAVIYGKEKSYVNFLNENRRVLQIVSEYLEIHTTMKETPDHLPFPVVNHGVLAYDDLLELLSESLLFVGLGFPYNGPGPLDAIAEGCLFLQPSFREGKNRWTDNFFKGKPTSLTYPSQHPYLEQFVGAPWVYTLDYANESAVRTFMVSLIEQHPSSPSVGYIPHELTAVGFFERVGILVEKLITCERGNLATGRLALVRLPSATPGSISGDRKKIEEEESVEASKVTDGVWKLDSCYHMHGERGVHDVCVELSSEFMVWVWKVVVRLLPTWNRNLSKEILEGGVSVFYVSLLDSKGNELTREKFRVDRVSYEVLYQNVSGVHEVCMSVGGGGYKGEFSKFVVCELEAYGQESYSQIWPSRSQLRVVMGEKGESCKSRCLSSGLICARNLFHVLDSVNEVEFSIGAKCGEDIKLMIAGPGLEETDKGGDIYDVCILNRDPMVYSCAAVSANVRRLCPCVTLYPGQNGLPLIEDF